MPEAKEHAGAPAMTTAAFTFAVRRQEPVLVGPAAPTPRETKRLSDIDDQETLRGYVTFLFFYRHGAHDDRDPASIIRRALGEALVPYYPLAGRVREVEARKLVVDCTGEGVMFVEADADVRLAELEAAATGLTPPFPCVDQLLFDVDGSSGVLGCPLLLIQVTRLLCRGDSLLFSSFVLPSLLSSSRAVISRALPPFLERGLDMAAAHAVAKGSVVSPGGSRAAPGLLSRRRGAVAARMAPAAMRIGGSWKKTAFLGGRLAVGPRRSRPASRTLVASPVQMNMNLAIGKSVRWWEKGLQPNIREIESAQDLVDSLANAGDRLVIVDFFSPGCGGCRALHPKICQFAEQNPDVLFLQVNHEEHKSMCYSLHVHVLPFFRLYRGAQGRLCSFSCTNATIKKFKDALAKHKPDRCSIGPTIGLEESELLALAGNKDLQFTYTKKPELIPSGDAAAEVIAPEPTKLPAATKPSVKIGSESEERSLVSSGR